MSTGFVSGMQAAFVTSGREANVILMGSGSRKASSEARWRCARVASSRQACPVWSSRLGSTRVSPEAHIAIPVEGIGTDGAAERDPRHRTGSISRAPRGPGRRWASPRTGASVLAGMLVVRSMGFDPPEAIIGTVVEVDDDPYTIIGIHEADGGVAEGELWTAAHGSDGHDPTGFRLLRGRHDG